MVDIAQDCHSPIRKKSEAILIFGSVETSTCKSTGEERRNWQEPSAEPLAPSCRRHQDGDCRQSRSTCQRA